MATPPSLEHLSPEVRTLLRDTGALLEGHFLLTSGRHSAHYLQAMRLLQHPTHAQAIARSVAGAFRGAPVAATVAPAIGGIVWGHVLAACLPGARALFAERVNGVFELRRGFQLAPGETVILAEDVTTTGGTVEELRALVEAAGATVAGVAAVVDRSGGRWNPGVPFVAWARLDVETFDAGTCPLCAAGSVAIKPGSRPGLS